MVVLVLKLITKSIFLMVRTFCQFFQLNRTSIHLHTHCRQQTSSSVHLTYKFTPVCKYGSSFQICPCGYFMGIDDAMLREKKQTTKLYLCKSYKCVKKA